MLSIGGLDSDSTGAQAVKRYKQSTGLEVEPAVQAQAQVTAGRCSGVVCCNNVFGNG